MVTNAPGQVPTGLGVPPGSAPGDADVTGRGGGRSQIGARTHMSITYSSRFQQVTWPSSIGAQEPSARGRHPASPKRRHVLVLVLLGRPLRRPRALAEAALPDAPAVAAGRVAVLDVRPAGQIERVELADHRVLAASRANRYTG